MDHWALTPDGVAYWTTGDVDPPPNATVPVMDSAAPLATRLRGYPGRVMVPPPDLAPFADLPITTVKWPVQSQSGESVGYELAYGASINFSGFNGYGRSTIPPACPQELDYCPESTQAPETFRGFHVGAAEAMVTHSNHAQGPYWLLFWDEAETHMLYQLLILEPLASELDRDANSDSAAVARQLVSLANQFQLVFAPTGTWVAQ